MICTRSPPKLGADSHCNRTTASFHEDFMRRPVAEAFAWSMIQFVDDIRKRFFGYVSEIHPLWEVSAQQPIGVFVGPALPRRIGVGEIHLQAGLFLNIPVMRKFLAVVQRQRVPQLFRNAAKLASSNPGCFRCSLVTEFAGNKVTALALDVRRDVSAALGTFQRVAFPIAKSLTRGNHCGA